MSMLILHSWCEDRCHECGLRREPTKGPKGGLRWRYKFARRVWEHDELPTHGRVLELSGKAWWCTCRDETPWPCRIHKHDEFRRFQNQRIDSLRAAMLARRLHSRGRRRRGGSAISEVLHHAAFNAPRFIQGLILVNGELSPGMVHVSFCLAALQHVGAQWPDPPALEVVCAYGRCSSCDSYGRVGEVHDCGGFGALRR